MISIDLLKISLYKVIDLDLRKDFVGEDYQK